MFITAYTTGTVLGDADSRRAAAFRALASGFLGMDGRRGRIPISLRSSFPNAVPVIRVGRVLRTAVARRLGLANRRFEFQKRGQSNPDRDLHIALANATGDRPAIVACGTGEILRSGEFYTIKLTANSCIGLCSSKIAVSFSSARTMKRFPLRCASTSQIVHPSRSRAET